MDRYPYSRYTILLEATRALAHIGVHIYTPRFRPINGSKRVCEAFLAYVIDTKKEELSLSDIPTINDYPDVFPEELPRLPPQREIEFAIDVVRGATLASITPYQMAPV